jgi:hypothetical protein
VARRETIVVAGDDEVQFVERIAVGHPGLALLVGVEEVAGLVESESDGHADAGGDRAQLLRAGVQLLDGPAARLDVVERELVVARIGGLRLDPTFMGLEPRDVRRLQVVAAGEAIRVGVVLHQQAEVDVARGIHGHGRGIYIPGSHILVGPVVGHDLLRVRLPVAVGIPQERDLAAAGDVEALGRPAHPERHGQRLLVPPGFSLVFQAVAVRVAQLPDPAVIAERSERAVGGEAEVVLVAQMDGKLLHGEAGHEHRHFGDGGRSGDESASGQDKAEQPSIDHPHTVAIHGRRESPAFVLSCLRPD